MTVAQLIELLQQMPQHHYVTAHQRGINDEAGSDDVLEFATGIEEVRPIGSGIVVLVAE